MKATISKQKTCRAYPIQISSSSHAVTGSRNLQTGKPCRDVILTRKYDSFFFFGLADGQGFTNHGAEGGLTSLEAIAAFFHKQGLSSLFSYPFPDEFPYILMQQIRNCLTALAQNQGCAFSEYASTLNAIAIDPITGRYILLHLGDGCTIGVKRDNSLFFLSPPETGFPPHHTWLTTSCLAVSHLHLGFGSTENLKRIVLLTDGADSLCRGKNITVKGRKVLLTEQHLLIHALHQSTPTDDAGCIVIDLNNA